ncbi:MAG: hypothetical protein QW660_07950 [Candidatus Bathyarchaeia archaeon]
MAQTQGRRWQFSEAERMQIREVLGKLILGPSFQPEKPIIEQVREQLGGPILGQRLQALGFLASSNPAPEEKPREEPEWAKMPEDYLGGPEEWAKLTEAEKRAIHEALKAGRKTYISKYVEEPKRATLDGPVSQELKLKKLLGS